MSEQSPYEQLGVTENSSFEEIQEAKQRLIQEHAEEAQVIEGIEAAYDAIIMDRLRQRQEGKIKVPDRIRFPEKAAEPAIKVTPLPLSTPPNWLQRFLDRPSNAELLRNSGVFLTLGAISLFVQDREGSLLPLLLAPGVFATIYFLNRKENRFGRAILFTLLGLLFGIGVGALIANLVTLPLPSQQFYSLITFLVFWFISNFVR
jgi:hypothetical protein